MTRLAAVARCRSAQWISQADLAVRRKILLIAVILVEGRQPIGQRQNQCGSRGAAVAEAKLQRRGAEG